MNSDTRSGGGALGGEELSKALPSAPAGAIELATLLAPAVRIESALLRACRLELCPHLDVGAESDLWFSDLIEAHGVLGIIVADEYVEPLLARLRDVWIRDEQRASRAWALIERFHHHPDNSPPLVHLEEQVHWAAVTGASSRELEDLLAPAWATLQPASGVDGVARWARRALPRLPGRARETTTAWAIALGAGARLGATALLSTDAPGDLDAERLDWLLSAMDLPTRRLAVRRVGDLLELNSTAPDADAILVTDTDPVLLRVGSGSKSLVAVHRVGGTVRQVGWSQAVVQSGRRVYDLPSEPGSVARVVNDAVVQLADGSGARGIGVLVRPDRIVTSAASAEQLTVMFGEHQAEATLRRSIGGLSQYLLKESLPGAVPITIGDLPSEEGRRWTGRALSGVVAGTIGRPIGNAVEVDARSLGSESDLVGSPVVVDRKLVAIVTASSATPTRRDGWKRMHAATPLRQILVPRDTVFVSFSHEDRDPVVRRFVELLRLYLQEPLPGVRLSWDDYIGVGDDWRAEMDDTLERTAAALLFVSHDFLTSPFIMEHELPALRTAGVPLLAAIVRPCAWEAWPELADRQLLHDPERDGVILAHEGLQLESEILRLVRVARDSLLEVEWDGGLRRPSSTDPGPRITRATADSISGVSTLGELDGVPAEPLGYLPRPVDVERARALLLEGGSDTAAIAGRAVGLHGEGGIGKSVLAAALARDDRVRRAFPDGIYWLSVGRDPEILLLQRELAERLGVEIGEIRSISETREALAAVLRERRILVVVDDVWSISAAEAFRVTGEAGRVLYTTRRADGLRGVGALTHRVDVLGVQAAAELLRRVSQVGLSDDDPAVEVIHRCTGGTALGLAVVAASVGRDRRSWSGVAAELEVESDRFSDHAYADTFQSMHVALGRLDEEVRRCYVALAVFPEDLAIPVAAIRRLWAAHGHDSDATDAIVDELLHRGLLSATDAIAGHESVGLHVLQREFLLLSTRSLRLAHRALLDAYRDTLARPGDWSTLPVGEPYAWTHIVDHMLFADEVDLAHGVIRSLDFLVHLVQEIGAFGAERVLDAVAQIAGEASDQASLHRCFAQGASTFDRDRAAENLRSTIYADLTAGGIQLTPSREAPWLQLRHGLRPLASTSDGHPGFAAAVAISADGTTIASGGSDGIVRVWRADAGTPQNILAGLGRVRAVAISADGETVASSGTDGIIRVWDAVTGTPRTSLDAGQGWVGAMAISADGTTVASGGNDGIVRIWNAVTGTQRTALEGHHGWVRAVAISADGSTIACGGRHGTLRIWDAVTGTQRTTLEGHLGWVAAMAISGDGTTIASGGTDGTVRIWDATLGSEVARVTLSQVRAVALAAPATVVVVRYRDLATFDIVTSREQQ